ncbi:hypothetical protein [Kitasatospora paranensis]|uniref:Uncharacterized protein n=1 Tax=Kitasatospora paranensis TaxID=258053 RepID=A0ABW2FL99_9ACTN
MSRNPSPRPHNSRGADDAPRPRRPLAKAVRNLGIMIDTAARVVFLGRDGV